MNEEDNVLNLDELDQIETNADNKLKVKNRFEKLSTDLIQEKKRNEEAARAREEAEQKAAELAKEAEFYKGFNSISSKYPNASDFQEQIKEKVRSGYDLEDAAVAILAREGKLGGMQDIRPVADVAGGSAATTLPQEDRGVGEMTQAERLEALSDLDKKGELEKILFGNRR